MGISDSARQWLGANLQISMGRLALRRVAPERPAARAGAGMAAHREVDELVELCRALFVVDFQTSTQPIMAVCLGSRESVWD